MDSLEKIFSAEDNCESLIRKSCEYIDWQFKMMIDRISLVILIVAVLAYGAPIESEEFNSELNTPVPILSQTELNSPDGSFSYRYFDLVLNCVF